MRISALRDALEPPRPAKEPTQRTRRSWQVALVTLRRGLRRFVGQQIFVAVTLFVLCLLLFSLNSPAFFTPKNLANLSRSFSWLAIVALGQSLVIIIGGIDLSMGATMALAGLVTARAMQLGMPIAPAVMAGLCVGGATGWVNGMLIARVRLPAFVVTLGAMGIQRGLAYALTGGWSITNLPEGFLVMGQADVALGPWQLPTPLLIALALAVCISLLLRRTVLGGDIYAMSSGERALLVSGVNVVRLKILVYTLCGVLAAAGGLLLAARLGLAASSAAVGYEVDAVAAAVIGGVSLFGGVGSTLGILLGAMITQVLSNGLVLLNYPSYWQTAAVCALMILTVLLDYWRRQRQAVSRGPAA